MESFWFRYGANYCNSQDDFGCIIRKFSKIILLFFGFYEAHVSNLQVVEFIVKCNLERGWRTDVTPVEFPWGNPIQLGKEDGERKTDDRRQRTGGREKDEHPTSNIQH